MKALLNAALVLFLYKPVSNALKAAHFIERRENEQLGFGKKTVFVMIGSMIIGVAAVLVLLLGL